MEQSQWLMLAAGLLGGGAMGAIITALVTTWRNRVQPVGYRWEAKKLFESVGRHSGTLPLKPGDIVVDIAISDDTGSFTLTNLHAVELQIINRGNEDKKSFHFGATLPQDHNILTVEPTTVDRHHRVIVPTPPTPRAPASEVDFELTPFNRGDRYTIIMLINLADTANEVAAVALSSPDAVVFSPAPSMAEIAARLANATTVSFGPLRVSVGFR
jgi:hypothetical protein